MAAKQSWTQKRSKDSKNESACLLEQAQYEDLLKTIPKQRCITLDTLISKHKIGGAVARRLLADLEQQGKIIPVVKHHRSLVYTSATAE